MFWKVCRKENRLCPKVSYPRLLMGIEESEWKQFRKHLCGHHKKNLQRAIFHYKITLPFFVQFNKSVDNSTYFHVHFVSQGKVIRTTIKNKMGKNAKFWSRHIHKDENIKQMVEN